MRIRVADEPAERRLMRQVRDQQRRINEPVPTARQVAMVLHALADHTAIQSMLIHRHDKNSPWPAATSVGRWFHDVGDVLEDMAGGDDE